MINKKVAFAILGILVASGILAYLLVSPTAADATTAPQWVKNTISTTSGVGSSSRHPVYAVASGDRALSTIQFDNVADLEVTGYGRNFNGVWTRIFPVTFASAVQDSTDATSDTTAVFSSGSPALSFPGVKLEVFFIHSGTAENAWGE